MFGALEWRAAKYLGAGWGCGCIAKTCHAKMRRGQCCCRPTVILLYDGPRTVLDHHYVYYYTVDIIPRAIQVLQSVYCKVNIVQQLEPCVCAWKRWADADTGSGH